MNFFRYFPYTEYDFFNTGVKTKVVDIFRSVKAITGYLDSISAYRYYQIRETDRPDNASVHLYGVPHYYWTFFIINDALREGTDEWPMTYIEFDDYMSENYTGKVIATDPSLSTNPDGSIDAFRNSVEDRFILGETITGSVSGATGILIKKDPQLQQLVLSDVTGAFTTSDTVTGTDSLDYVQVSTIYDYQHAPHHFEDDDGREVDNSIIVPSGYENPNVVTNREYEEALNESRRNIRVIRPELIKRFADRFFDLIKQ